MKRILSIIVLFSAFAFLLCPSARAIGLIIVDEQQPPPSIAVPNDPRVRWPRMPRPIFRYTPLEIRSARVTGSIKDQVAHTKIEEEFYNPSPSRLEGTFILPLPKGAHLDRFAMEINGKMAEAELL